MELVLVEPVWGEQECSVVACSFSHMPFLTMSQTKHFFPLSPREMYRTRGQHTIAHQGGNYKSHTCSANPLLSSEYIQ